MSRPRVRVIRDARQAASIVAGGGLVAIPTETVYGLAADATNPAAVARVFAVKERPTDHPLILHLADAASIDDWVADAPSAARTLAAACWPGPLTLLLRRGPSVSARITGGRHTVAVRVPDHPLTVAMLTELGRPVVAPSANRFGSVSPTSAAHVLADLGERLDPDTDAILDGGESPVGVESTIVDCTVTPPQLLRPGGIALERLMDLVGDVAAPPAPATAGPARASGMLASHYAPRAQVVLVEDADQARRRLAEYRHQGRRAELLDIDDPDDLDAYARDLYAALRRGDERGADVIIAIRPEPHGLGAAIADRLDKAAANRPRSDAAFSP